MDPPNRSYAKRRSASVQNSMGASKLAADASPSPYCSITKPMQSGVEARRPSTSQTVSIGWDEEQEVSSIRIGVAECVETKTVTTTTTTKRSYPPLLVRQKPLASLDSKEYPLSLRETPAELANFSFELNGRMVGFEDVDEHNDVHVDLSRGDSIGGRTATQTSRPTYPHSQNKRRSFANHDTPKTFDVSKMEMNRSEHMDNKRSLINHKQTIQEEKAAKFVAPTSNQPRKSQLQSDQQSINGTIQSRKGDGSRRQALAMQSLENNTFPATPDMSELESGHGHRHRFESYFDDTNYTPRSGMSQTDSFDDTESQPDAAIQDLFSGAVATPPIAESDLEPLEAVNDVLAYSSTQRPSINTFVAQNASLPSPGLSPRDHDEEIDEFLARDGLDDDSITALSGDSQELVGSDFLFHGSCTASTQALEQQLDETTAPLHKSVPSVLETRTMLETFDSMPNEMKTFMMYQFLRRCSKKTLHTIAGVVNPALKCDFIGQLPPELGLHILSFLNHKDLCRAAQVSKQWRNVIDTNESGWKDLFDRDRFVLPIGELQKAIKQGWGWQDPYGSDGYEDDLSVPDSSVSTELDLNILDTNEAKSDTLKKILRSGTKRKRSSHASGSDRSKRRSNGYELTVKTQDNNGAKFAKSEGPLTAANAAALAVPEASTGLASLRKLHLFKSLYRRHYMLRRNWTSGKVEPRHFAFPAHPSHVITCLQFDDDKILTGSDDTLIHVYDTRTGKLRKKLEGHEGGVWALQYEGNVLVSGSTDRSVRVWDIEKGLCTQVFHGHTSTVRCLQILMPEATGRTERGHAVMLPEKPLIITGSRDSQLRVWKLPEQGSKRYIQTGPPANDADCPYFVRTLSGHSHSVRAIAAHQDTLVSGSYDNTVRVWKISTGETVHRLQGHSMKVYSVVLDTKRNRCISGSMDTYVKIWSLETGACLFTLEGHTSLVGLLDLRDERLVSAAADSSLRIWDPENGQCKSTLTAHTGAITCFQHDGQKVISGSDRTLKMWDVKTGECIKDLLTDLSGVWQVKFDARRCVAAVQRDNRTFVEVIDFGASRDGVPVEKRGFRDVEEPDKHHQLEDDRIEEEDDQ